MVLAYVVHMEVTLQSQMARSHYFHAEHDKTEAVARQLNDSLGAIYENLRTLSYLPSLRKIDRHGTNIDGDGLGAIQQIYNNLANSVAVSEVYIVPAEFDPERMDPVTGKLEEPTLMFDELIIDAGRFSDVDNPFSERDAAGEIEPEIPEVEIHEYRQLVEQISWLKQNYPNMDSITGLKLPMISGDEVITCDNTEFVKTFLDGDRSGLMFSVPFFDLDGELKGTVTAIILSNALRRLLPGDGYSLVNADNGLTFSAVGAPAENATNRFITSATPNPNLYYSEVMNLSSRDPRANWSLWAGQPNSKFHNSAEAKAVLYFERSGYAGIVVLVVIALTGWALFRRHMSVQRSVAAKLEARVAERTAEIEHMAMHDALTGLPNRTLWHKRIFEDFADQNSNREPTIYCIDVDHFKSINDTLGHAVGDALLKIVAARMLNCVRENDTLARLGGDEFVIYQPETTTEQQKKSMAERLINKVAEPIQIDGHQVQTSISIGFASLQTKGADHEVLLKMADLALYRAKHDGRSTFSAFEPDMDALIKKRKKLEAGLQVAIEADEFVLHYQPIVDAKSEEIVGFEALLRWNHPELGLLPPLEFIPIAEEIGAIHDIGEWVLHRACADAVQWPKRVRVAVNLSAIQFQSDTLGQKIVTALATSGLSPKRFEIEITETLLLGAEPSTIELLNQLRNMGIRVAMDDFGTGYSSLSNLHKLPFDKIKIDRSFVKDIGTSESCLSIFTTIAAMGNNLGMVTTAEGVETLEQLEIVRSKGCSELQGYFFGKPEEQAKVLELLSAKTGKAAKRRAK